MAAKQAIRIGKKSVGEGRPVFIIAEAGVNHNGKFSFAKRLINAAAAAAADAVKFQTFSPDELVTKSAAKSAYQARNELEGENPPRAAPFREGGKGKESQYTMLKRLALPRKYYAELKRRAEKRGLVFLSTPFSLDDAKFLRALGVKAIKVGSSDANNYPYLRRVAVWGLPIILSTGMTGLAEVREAVRTIKKARNKKLILLHCTTNYPTPFSEANLFAIKTLQKEFGVPIGFSDHTAGNEAAIASVALGACVIEKHITLDKTLPGPDHRASMEPEEFCDFVRRIRNTEAALGSGKKVPSASEKEIAKAARKSVVTVRYIKKGGRFTEKNLGIKRPGTGFAPKYRDMIIGRRAAEDIAADVVLIRSHFKR